MKWLIALLFPLFVHASSLKPLESLYQIEEDVLIDYEGNRHLKIDFLDPFHEDLAFVLKDPEQAKIIHEAFSKMTLNSPEIREPFSKAILKTCFLFGATHFSPEKALLTALKDEVSALNWIDAHSNEFKTFIDEANLPARPNLVPDHTKFRVVILTTTASGGNYSVATTMKKYLDSLSNVECIVLDVETVAVESDPIMLATGATTYDGIYAKYFQQENLGLEPVLVRDELSKKLGKYIPSRLSLNLKEKMRELKPDLIISTRSYTLDDVSLCTLGVPFRMIHCDYELSFFLLDLYGMVEPEMMQFWLPTFEPSAFRPLFEKLGRLDLYDSPGPILEKTASLLGKSLIDTESLFVLSGYPVRSEFSQITDKSSLEELRKKWGVESGETPILVCMGSNGVGVLEEIFNELSTSLQPFKYFVVCGKNSKLQESLKMRSAGNSHFSIQGFLSFQEMNELMNICPITLSKPGGAFVSETLATGTFLLMDASHPWEEANGNHVESHGLGKRVEKNRPLDLQIVECLRQKLIHKYLSNDEWKNLIKYLP